MSLDYTYAKDRYYPIFEPGDEVYTTKRYKAITSNKPYTVIRCSKKPGMSIDIWVITLITDGGYESEYATYQFNKTDSQIRHDKLDSIL